MTSILPEPDSYRIEGEACQRCGTCCRRGGPTLHIEDRCLVEEGVLPLKTLVTCRRGEPVHDQIQGRVVPLTAEIIKIRGQGRQWTCVFFDPANNSCAIYDHRPLECHNLKCWDTSDLERIYAKDRLCRKDLVASVEGLAELIDLHEQRCNYTTFSRLARAANRFGRPAAARALGRMVGLDADLRRLTAEKGGLDPLINDFLFGRPLGQALNRLDLKPLIIGEKTNRRTGSVRPSADKPEPIAGIKRPLSP